MAGTRRPFIGLSTGSPYGQFPLAAAGYFPNPELLIAHLTFDGTNGSSAIPDDDKNGYLATRVAGSGTISTTSPRIGTGCWSNQNASASRIIVAISSPYLPTQNWTIGGWVRRDGACNSFGLGSVGAVRYILLKTPESNGNYELGYAESGIIAASTTSIGGTWTHWEVNRRLNGATPELYIFINGQLESFTTGTSGGSPWLAGQVDIGTTDTGGFSGHYGAIDDWYLYAECLHTSSFTPPEGPVYVP